MTRTRFPWLLVLALAAWSVTLTAGPVKFKNTFIETFKNRVTMDITFRVDQAHESANDIGTGSDDGDMHVAGRSTQVGLPMVVEILNADAPAQQPMVDLMKAKLGKPPSSLSGVWRIWYEHQAAALQTQGGTVPVPHDTNPLHVFEIHPVTEFAGTSALASFVPIPGYVAYSAETAFTYYEGMKFRILRDSTFTQIKSPMGRYNYAEFDIVVAGTPQLVSDGVMVFAEVVDSSGQSLVVEPRRMVAAAGTAPAQKLGAAKTGAKFRVLGIPRINLERVSTHAVNGTEVKILGAYEMIIAAIIGGT